MMFDDEGQVQSTALVVGDARAREEIATHLDATLFVEAGAGTGKTSALVSRVIALVRSEQVELREIAAITFTEAAASELRDRIHGELDKRSSPSLDGSFARRALEQLDEAAITTIHGFAMRILSEHPLESGLPLRFRVLDAIETSLRFEHSMSAFLDAFYDGDEEIELATATLAIGVTPDHLRSLARAFDENNFDAFDEASLETHAASYEQGLATLRAMTEEGTEALLSAIGKALAFAPSCEDPSDRLVERLDVLAEAATAGERTADWVDRLVWALALAPQRVGNVGKRGNWIRFDIVEVREAVGVFEEERITIVNQMVEVVLEMLALRLRVLARSFAAERRRDGELSFHDLLVATRDLLVGNDHVRKLVRSRYRRILVDEFQDTDPLQLEIVMALGGDVRGGPIEDGRLFFVGDPRQSIYRFRGAQPELYEAARHGLIEGEPVRLLTNFRSVPGVLEFVNSIFAQLFAGDASADVAAFPTVSVARAPQLESARASLEVRVPVAVLGGAGPDGESVGVRRERESGEIGAFISSAIANGLLVEDDGVKRAARFGDVAILIPRRTGLPELERALDEWFVPYRLESTALVYRATEVRDLLACLRAIDLPGDEPALLAALRTPYFACGDDDLLSFRSLGGEWSLERPQPPECLDHVVGDAIAALRSLFERHHGLGVYGTIRTLIEERDVMELAIGQRHPHEAMRRIEFVCNEARQFCDGGGTSFSEFLLFTELQADLGARTIDVTGSDGEDAVRILTIHGAKGLEFPVVVLAELGGSVRAGPQPTRVLRRRDGGLEMRAASGRVTAGFEALSDEEERLEREERLRLCYVGATRARDHLVISLHHEAAKSAHARSLAQLLEEACSNDAGTWRVLESSTALHRRIAASAEPRDSLMNEDDYDELRARHVALTERVARPTSVAASGLALFAPEEFVRRGGVRPNVSEYVGTTEDDGEDDGEVVRGGSAQASALGRAVHQVLESVDLGGKQDASALIDRAALEEGIQGSASEVASLVDSALAAPSIIEAAASAHWRELPITAVIAGRVLEAIIDLCYEHDGELTIVDYKTDALADPAEAIAAAERYRLQGGAYALALSSVLGRPVERMVFLFLTRGGDAVEVELFDLEGAMSAARAVVLDNVEAVLDPVLGERASA